MKYRIFFAALILFISTTADAQKVSGCGYIIPPKQLFKTKFQSVYEASGIVKEMLDSVKWKENFTLKEQNGMNNAYATIINRTRWIVYDNDFLENLDAYANTKWASISVLAHEMGHHYYNHVVSGKGSTVPTEIEADYFSGYAMAKYGASLDQSIAAMQSIATDKASSTRGWNAAKAASTGNAGNNPAPPVNPPAPSTPTPATPAPNPPATGGGMDTNTDPNTDPSWIALSIQSNKTETVQLSDDGKRFQSAEIKANEPFVFKFEIYPYGWLRLKYYNGYRTYKLMHGKDYNILWNRRTKNWTVVEVPE
jgi:hypothetical protein